MAAARLRALREPLRTRRLLWVVRVGVGILVGAVLCSSGCGGDCWGDIVLDGTDRGNSVAVVVWDVADDVEKVVVCPACCRPMVGDNSLVDRDSTNLVVGEEVAGKNKGYFAAHVNKSGGIAVLVAVEGGVVVPMVVLGYDSTGVGWKSGLLGVLNLGWVG